MIDLHQARRMVESYLTDTEVGRELAEKCRDYYDHKQWTAEEVAILRARRQAPIQVNRIRPKIEGLTGLYSMRQTDPKAYSRTQAHEEASHVTTDGLRFVGENNQWDTKRVEVCEEVFVEGCGAGVVDVRQKRNGEFEIMMRRIPWDRFIYDPHSREKDYSDAAYLGEIIWMYTEDARAEYGLEADFVGAGDETDDTLEDRPRYSKEWYDPDRHRLRIAKIFYRVRGVWHVCMFSGNEWIIEPQVSPFLDDEGEPACIIEGVSANIDRDNQRYSECRTWLDLQDEINHRRSKFLHAGNQKQTWGRTGSIADMEKFQREKQKPDGHFEFNGDEYGKDFGFVQNMEMSQAQFEMYRDGMAQMDAVSFNAQLAGERQEGNLSGRAIEKLQAAGTLELNRQFQLLMGWENRMYRQVWARIKQFWTEERWVRVTDDQDALRWVGFNSQITVADRANEIMEDESLPLEQRQQVAQQVAMLDEMAQMAPEMPNPLDEIVEVQNDVAELDMDISIDQSYDVVNVQEEQFRLLAELAAQSEDIDFVDLIRLSNIRGKDELIEKIEQRRAEGVQMRGQIDEMEAQKAQIELQREQIGLQKDLSEIENTNVDSVNKATQAEQRAVETDLMQRQPDLFTSIAV